jgi:hypothetical protein
MASTAAAKGSPPRSCGERNANIGVCDGGSIVTLLPPWPSLEALKLISPAPTGRHQPLLALCLAVSSFTDAV